MYGIGGLDFDYNSFVSFINILIHSKHVMFIDFQSQLMTYDRRLPSQKKQIEINALLRQKFGFMNFKNSSLSNNQTKNSSIEGSRWDIHDFLKKQK